MCEKAGNRDKIVERNERVFVVYIWCFSDYRTTASSYGKSER